MSRRILAGVMAGIALVGLLFAIATAHQMREGARAIAESDAALAHADTVTAIARARAAAEAAAPASPHPARAYERLGAMARDAEAHGNETAAIAAWSAMRAAAIETRGPLVDTDRWRALADEGIARVGSGASGASDGRAGSESRATQAALRDVLARDEVPTAGRALLLALAALLFFAGAARLAWIHAEPEEAPAPRGRADGKAALLPASVAVVGLALYLLACLQG